MDLEEFLDVTPRFFAALLEKEKAKRRIDQEMTELMGAQIVAMVRRCGFIQFDELMSAKDFMPTVWERQAKAAPKRQTKAEKGKIAEAWRVYLKRAAGITA